VNEPVTIEQRDLGRRDPWALRALLGSGVAAGLCGGLWWIADGPHPDGTIACGVMAALAAGWAAARAARSGVFVVLVCVGSTLTVVSTLAMDFPFGGAGVILPFMGAAIVLATIRAWMKSEGFI
jgi:hypothetical protein